MSNPRQIDWPSEEEINDAMTRKNPYSNTRDATVYHLGYNHGWENAIEWLSTRLQPDKESEPKEIKP